MTLFSFRVENGVELPEELFGFGEGLVHRDEPDVRDLIEVSEVLGDKLADRVRIDDSGVARLERRFDVVDNGCYRRFGNTSFLDSAVYAGPELLPSKRLNASIALFHLQ